MPALEARLAAIAWDQYATAYSNAASDHRFQSRDGITEHRWGSIPEQLLQLTSTEPVVALDASHHLWCCLCHQHAYVSPAALPALPFLLEILDGASDQLAIELMDIMLGFATCTTAPTEAWMGELREQLVVARPVFDRFAGNANEELADFATAVVSALASPGTGDGHLQSQPLERLV